MSTQPHTKSNLVARTAVSVEYASLMGQGHCPLGIYILPTSGDLMIWDGVLFVHQGTLASLFATLQGFYADSVIKFRLTFPEHYPERPPTVQFVTDIFHPLISYEGAFNFSHRFRPWRPKEHHVFDVLHCVKSAFKRPTLDTLREEDCLNKEAFRYRHSPQSFASLATQSVQLSQSESALFGRDHPSRIRGPAHTLQFQKLNAEQLRQQKERVGLLWPNKESEPAPNDG
ncbi:ubiquitin-conjugating enzyme/RWD-like protein [Coprinopsis sp. MPI-PUGE-AT-0042]|nr:ubiquitin-conjugating enzyme/RWD-like protein [Coprinopsis sp. MPI-PUGE-AT-0042]